VPRGDFFWTILVLRLSAILNFIRSIVLLDVPRRIGDGYEMLAESSGEEFPYIRFLRLVAAGNEQVFDLAGSSGQPGGCSTCTGTLGSETGRFRATVIGTLVSDSGSPQTNVCNAKCRFIRARLSRRHDCDCSKDNVSFTDAIKFHKCVYYLMRIIQLSCC